jgi:hypothetical protein
MSTGSSNNGNIYLKLLATVSKDRVRVSVPIALLKVPKPSEDAVLSLNWLDNEPNIDSSILNV